MSMLSPTYAATERPEAIAQRLGLSLETLVMIGCGDEHAACLGAGYAPEQAHAWARELGRGSRTAIALSKAILDRTFETAEEQVFGLGRQAQAVCYTTAEHQDSVNRFLQKTDR